MSQPSVFECLLLLERALSRRQRFKARIRDQRSTVDGGTVAARGEASLGALERGELLGEVLRQTGVNSFS